MIEERILNFFETGGEARSGHRVSCQFNRIDFETARIALEATEHDDDDGMIG